MTTARRPGGIPRVVIPPPRSRRGRAAAIAGLTAALTLASAAVGAGVASAAPPAFPDNVVVFPDRDFVTIEGYQDRIGQTALGDAEPRIADLPSNDAVLYRTPIAITAADTKLNFVAFDENGNFSDTVTQTFQPTAAAAPAAPTTVAASALDRSTRVTWTAPAGPPAPTKYVVTATPASGAPVTQEAPAAATSATVAGLTNGVDYAVTVTAYAGTAAGPASEPPVTVRPVALVDRLTITSARWKAGDFRVGGTGSVTGANLTVHRVNADGTAGAAITGATATVTAPVAPATVGNYSVRVRAGAPTTNPGRIIVKSDKGGATAPFTVTNG
jgi:hypothetical protein